MTEKTTKKMKLWKYFCELKPAKCRPCKYVEDYIQAADFWDANKAVYDLYKNNPAKILTCKIVEVQ